MARKVTIHMRGLNVVLLLKDGHPVDYDRCSHIQETCYVTSVVYDVVVQRIVT